MCFFMIKLVYLVPLGVGVERVLGCQHGRGDHDAHEDNVAEVAVVADVVAHDAEPRQKKTK